MRDNIVNSSKSMTASRRKLIQAVGVAAGSMGFGLEGVTLTSAKTEEYLVGESVFVETKVEFPDVNSEVVARSHGLLKYIVDTRNNRVAVNSDLGDVEGKELIVTNGQDFIGAKKQLPLQRGRTTLIKRTDYRRHDVERVPLRKPITIPAIRATVSGESIIVHVRNNSMVIKPNQEKTIKLSKISPRVVTNRKENSGEDTSQDYIKKQTVVPNITIHNHGMMSVLAGDSVRVIPMTTNDTYANSRIKSHLNVKPERIIQQTDNDLLIIDEPNMKHKEEKISKSNEVGK